MVRTRTTPTEKVLGTKGPTRYGFLIVPEFTFYGLFPAIEALRVANLHSGRKLYEWQLISEDGGSMAAANGMAVRPDSGIDGHSRLDALFVVFGNHPLSYCSPRLVAWLRHLDHLGTTIGAFDSGAFLVAAAGLADGHHFALHWDTIPVFREIYPEIAISERLYNIDGRRITCAGGSASLDLFLELIERDHGIELASIVSDGFIHGVRRRGYEDQRPGHSHVTNAESALLRRVVAVIEDSIDTPMGSQEIARQCNKPLRTIERLFQRNFGISIMKFYLNRRLEVARGYILYSTMQVQAVSLACGFSSPPVFCRSFKIRYGHTPGEFRKRHLFRNRHPGLGGDDLSR